MAAGFNADEVLELACQIERYGARFYRLAAKRLADEVTQKLLVDLAAYEDQHLETFMALKAGAAAGDAALAGLDEVTTQYLQAMANGLIFDVDGDPADRLGGGESVDEILRLALQMEQDSIAFYTGLQAAMPAAWGPEKLDQVIREERSHVVHISTVLAARYGGA